MSLIYSHCAWDVESVYEDETGNRTLKISCLDNHVYLTDEILSEIAIAAKESNIRITDWEDTVCGISSRRIWAHQIAEYAKQCDKNSLVVEDSHES